MSSEEPICSLLSGGDRRSIGRTEEVIALIRQKPKKIVDLLECLWNPDHCISMRAADATEKISREQAALLQPYKAALLGLLAEATQQELRWHLALIVPRLHLTCSECQRAAGLLQTYLEDRSSIVKTFALQGLSDLIQQDASLQPMVLDLLRSAARTGTPAMRARSRILLKQQER